MNKKEEAIKIAKDLNKKLEASIINVPVLEGFNIIKNTTSDDIVFAAITEDHYIEQLVAGDYLNEQDTLESKIEESIQETKEFINKSNLESPLQNFILLKELESTFKFKIYVQDYIIKTSTPSGIRQLNAYFIEPRYNKFYQLSLSTGPIAIPSTIYEPGKIDLENDNITKDLIKMMDTILTNIKYV